LSMSLAEFHALKQSTLARSRVKNSCMVVNGIAYQPEQYESYQFHQWLVAKGIYSAHQANERKCSVQEMVMLKSMGLLPGAADHIIYDSPPIAPMFKGVLVEMKFGKNNPTAAQIDYLAEMRRRGWLGIVANGAQEAIAYMESLGY